MALESWKVLDFAWFNTDNLKRKIPRNRVMKGLGSGHMVRQRLEIENPRTNGFLEQRI